MYEDGSPAGEEIFVNEDGSMEYIILINATEYGGLAGKNIHVEFTDIGTVYKAEYMPDLEASWSFDFTLKGSDKVRTLTLSDPLGDTGATVIYAEISPISLYVRYDFPLREETIEGVNENQEIYTCSFVLDRILDTDQVNALLFLKEWPEENRAMTEEDVYIVPVEE